jgi:hypothetical protein
MGWRNASLVTVARRWWPVPALLGGSLLIQKVFFESRYDVSGHAAEHLSSATAPFAATAVVSILLWATPTGRRQADVLVACAAWLAATVLVLIGNVRVVDTLVDAGLGDARTDDVPDVADHGLANLATWLAVGAAVVLTAVMWLRGHVRARVAAGAGIMNLLFPPWIIPGAGVILLVVARCIARARVSSTLAGRP